MEMRSQMESEMQSDLERAEAPGRRCLIGQFIMLTTSFIMLMTSFIILTTSSLPQRILLTKQLCGDAPCRADGAPLHPLLHLCFIGMPIRHATHPLLHLCFIGMLHPLLHLCFIGMPIRHATKTGM